MRVEYVTDGVIYVAVVVVVVTGGVQEIAMVWFWMGKALRMKRVSYCKGQSRRVKMKARARVWMLG